MFVDFRTCFSDPKQFIRLIVLLSCVSITIYQLMGCIDKILHPPISTSNKLILNDSIKFPAITICRKPAFKTKLFPKYGLKQRAEISNKGAFRNFPFSNSNLDEFMEDTTYSLKETIYMYGYDGLIFNPTVNTFSTYYMQLGRCHTFETNNFATKLSIDGGIFFYFNHEGDKKTLLSSPDVFSSLKNADDGYYIFIHDSMEVIADLRHQKKSYSQSIFLESGESIYATLEVKEFNMVDRSDERCVSSMNYSQSTCNRKCLHNRIMEEFKCSLPWLRGDKTYPRCNDSEVIDSITSSLNYKREEYTAGCECPISCRLYFYCQKIVKRKPYGQDNYSLFFLYYDTSIVTVVQEVSSYNWYSLLADLGGSLGLFLGLSVIGFIEIIEACFTYVAKKRRQRLDKEKHLPSMENQSVIGTSIKHFLSFKHCTSTIQRTEYKNGKDSKCSLTIK